MYTLNLRLEYLCFTVFEYRELSCQPPFNFLKRWVLYALQLQLFAHAGKLTVHVAEKLEAESRPTIHYHFSEDLALAGVSLTDDFLTKHAELAGHTLSEAEQAEFEKITFVRPVR